MENYGLSPNFPPLHKLDDQMIRITRDKGLIRDELTLYENLGILLQDF